MTPIEILPQVDYLKAGTIQNEYKGICIQLDMEGNQEDFFNLDDFDMKGKTVLLRLDLNSPIHPLTGEIMSDTRFHSHVKTINRLKDSRVVILAHQSRPGKYDFVSLREHARVLQKILGRNVKFVDSLFGSEALAAIHSMRNGDILMLENTRFYSEDVVLDTSDFEVMEKTNFVRELSSACDFFVNDAFPAIHRNQTSLTGFTRVIPNIAGNLIQNETSSLNEFLNRKNGKKIAILAGSKIEDSIAVSRSFLLKNITEEILVGGVVANAFLWATGKDIGKKNRDFITKNNKKHEELIKTCRELVENYGDRIVMPEDFILNPSRARIHYLDKIPDDQILADIGPDTIAMFSEKIRGASAIFINGPMGMYELEDYSSGTYEILKEVARSEAMKIAGGGHTISAIETLKIQERIDHISTGGGALISYLSGEPMPVLEALKTSRKHFREMN